jgi:hypothetical protein
MWLASRRRAGEITSAFIVVHVSDVTEKVRPPKYAKE